MLFSRPKSILKYKNKINNLCFALNTANLEPSFYVHIFFFAFLLEQSKKVYKNIQHIKSL